MRRVRICGDSNCISEWTSGTLSLENNVLLDASPSPQQKRVDIFAIDFAGIDIIYIGRAFHDDISRYEVIELLIRYQYAYAYIAAEKCNFTY